MRRQLYNRPRSIYQYSNMAPRLLDQTSIFGVVFFVSKSLMGIERQNKLEKFAILTRKPRSHARILIYRTWPILVCKLHIMFNTQSERFRNTRTTLCINFLLFFLKQKRIICTLLLNNKKI